MSDYGRRRALEQLDVWNAGYVAARSGKSPADNPFPWVRNIVGFDPRPEWLCGLADGYGATKPGSPEARSALRAYRAACSDERSRRNPIASAVCSLRISVASLLRNFVRSRPAEPQKPQGRPGLRLVSDNSKGEFRE